MDNIKKLEELKWIYATLEGRRGVYLIEGVVDRAKDYSTSDVHLWAMDGGEIGTIYEKIRDLIKVRIFEAVAMGGDKGLDKGLAAEILKTYYYKPFIDATEIEKGGGNIVVNILPEEQWV